jgi:hypothetical protein
MRFEDFRREWGGIIFWTCWVLVFSALAIWMVLYTP